MWESAAVIIILKAGADINAAMWESATVIIILKAGADINAAMWDGATALFLAAQVYKDTFSSLK